MPKLSVIAQNLMDFFYKEEKADEQFFQFYHFRYLAASSWGAIMQTEWEQGYALGRAENSDSPFSPLPPEWFVPVTVQLNGKGPNYQADLSESRYFVFSKDKSSSGILDIKGNEKCTDFIRVNAYEKFGLKLMPHNNKSFWYAEGQSIGIFSHCGLKEVTILMIPAVDTENEDNDVDVPDVFEEKIRINVLQFMQGVDKGSVVDFTANYNTNKTIVSEIADYVKKQLGVNSNGQ